jgi:hypothetical protein
MPQGPRRAGDEVFDENGATIDTNVVTPQGPARQPDEPGAPRRRDEKKTAPQGRVDPAALAQRRLEGAKHIGETGVQFFHATNRAIVRLNERLKSQGIPWSADGGALWITTDAGSAFFNGNQVSPARTRQIYDRYGVPWDAEAARLANEPVFFEVDISRLPSPRDAGDVAADFAEGGNGRGHVNTDYTIKDLTGSPFDAMREINGPGPGVAPQPPQRPPDSGEPGGAPRASNTTAAEITAGERTGGEPSGSGGSGPGRPAERAPGPWDMRPHYLEYTTNDAVEAAQMYRRALAERGKPPDYAGVILLDSASDPARVRQTWASINNFGPDIGEPPAAWRDSLGNVYVDFTKAPLALNGEVPADTLRNGQETEAARRALEEEATQAEVEARRLEPDAVPAVGELRPIRESIDDRARALELFQQHQAEGRFIRVINRADFVEFAWRHEYAGGSSSPPIAWIDNRGYLVVDTERLFPGLAVPGEGYRAPMPQAWLNTPKVPGGERRTRG